MSNQTTNARRGRSKLKSVKNQPALGTFIEECQKAGLSFKDLSKLAESRKPITNKRQQQQTGDPSANALKNKKKPTCNSAPETNKETPTLEDDCKEICTKMSGIDLLQELKNMEQHITATLKSDKENELKNMEERLTNNLKESIDQSMKEAIQSLTSDSAKLISNNPVVQTNRAEIQDLKAENARLTKQVQVLSSEQSKLQHKIIVMEQNSLENLLVFRGISEDITECDYNLREKVYQELAHIFEGEDYRGKLTMAKNMTVKKCKRVGRFSHTRPRPISVEFEHCQDVEYIMESKGYLQHGTYVDREYVPEIERKRRILLPILKAAKLSKDYKKKCRLEDDKVVINGWKYGTDNLHQLPSEIDVFEITSKSDTDCVGLFGALNPLSNFYKSEFTVEGIKYISSEQYIQAQKALLFKDQASYNKIMGATKSLECSPIST